jgi:hypothetical protein
MGYWLLGPERWCLLKLDGGNRAIAIPATAVMVMLVPAVNAAPLTGLVS